MQPTLDQGDVLLISRTLYTPEYGDIIIIQEEEEPWEPLVKRIIAVGGQSIKINYKTGVVYVDGKQLEESLRIQSDIDFGNTDDENNNNENCERISSPR